MPAIIVSPKKLKNELCFHNIMVYKQSQIIIWIDTNTKMLYYGLPLVKLFETNIIWRKIQ
jgi:hypothetical protein